MTDESRHKTVTHPTEGAVTLELRYPNASHVKAGFKLYLELLKLEGSDEETNTQSASVLSDYLELLDEMTAKAIGKSVDWIDALNDEDKNQLTTWYDERVKKRADFMRSSGSAPTS